MLYAVVIFTLVSVPRLVDEDRNRERVCKDGNTNDLQVNVVATKMDSNHDICTTFSGFFTNIYIIYVKEDGFN